MARTRRKSPAQLAPQTLEQAISLLGEYRDLIDMVDDLADERDRAIARIKGEYDLTAAPLAPKIQEIFRQLRAWWAVAAPELTAGKRKSIELAGVIIGERTTPPALQLPKGRKAEDIADELLNWFGGDLVVTTNKLDKQAIIKLLRLSLDPDAADPDTLAALSVRGVLIEELGLSVIQKEEFFVDRPDKPATVEVVAEGAEA